MPLSLGSVRLSILLWYVYTHQLPLLTRQDEVVISHKEACSSSSASSPQLNLLLGSYVSSLFSLYLPLQQLSLA